MGLRALVLKVNCDFGQVRIVNTNNFICFECNGGLTVSVHVLAQELGRESLPPS